MRMDWETHSARKPRPDFGVDWVDPTRTLGARSNPYSYSEVYLWGGANTIHGAEAVYSDRLYQWDHAKADAASRLVGKGWRYWSEADAKTFLDAYFGEPITPTAMAEGCNISSGYPYWIFWFKRARKP